MSLSKLPEEVLILILNKLDTKSVKAVYETCDRFKKIVCMHNVIKECNFSLSTLATPKSITSQFFKDIAGHLQELNMCGVQDLCKTSLLSALKKLKVLKKLDVSHTSITINDLLDIHKVCPNIKSIKINLFFSKTPEKTEKILPRHLISRYQNMFKDFDEVHFVFDRTSLLNNLVFIVLREAYLRSLTCTHTQRNITNCVPENQIMDIRNVCETLELRFFDRKGSILAQIVLPQMYLRFKEYVIVRIALNRYWFSYDVHCSQSFKEFFFEHFGINAQTNIEKTKNDLMDPEIAVTRSPRHEVFLMLWTKGIEEFSDEFFKSLYQKIQPLIPINLLPAPLKNEMKSYTKNWIFLEEKRNQSAEEQTEEIAITPLKKKRTAPPSVTLDWDKICKDKQNIMLTVYFQENLRNPVALSPSSTYLREITHLSLTGYVVYDVSFFNVLFRNCHKLKTLDVELYKPTIATSFSNCLPLSHNLKNLRIVDDFINFSTLFSTLSQCKTLENIHIDETAEIEAIELPDPKLIFVNCVNLYNFTICAPLYEKTRIKKLRMYNKVKSFLGLHQLHINLIQGKDYHYVDSYEHHLLLSTFNPVPTYHVTRHIFIPM